MGGGEVGAPGKIGGGEVGAPLGAGGGGRRSGGGLRGGGGGGGGAARARAFARGPASALAAASGAYRGSCALTRALAARRRGRHALHPAAVADPCVFSPQSAFPQHLGCCGGSAGAGDGGACAAAALFFHAQPHARDADSRGTKAAAPAA